jgi:transcription elongation factor GreA
MAKQPMTILAKEMLEKELIDLIKNERDTIIKAIAEAREHGDLKENAEYHSAKEKQSHIEGRIGEIQAKLGNAQVIDISTISSDKIVFGATVTLFNEEKDESRTLQIVGEEEAASGKDKVSFTSPLGKALIGKEEGDEVIVKAPKGDVIYEVESLEYK